MPRRNGRGRRLRLRLGGGLVFGLESRVSIADGGGRELRLHGVELRELRHDLTDVMESGTKTFFGRTKFKLFDGWYFSTFQLAKFSTFVEFFFEFYL